MSAPLALAYSIDSNNNEFKNTQALLALCGIFGVALCPLLYLSNGVAERDRESGGITRTSSDTSFCKFVWVAWVCACSLGMDGVGVSDRVPNVEVPLLGSWGSRQHRPRP